MKIFTRIILRLLCAACLSLAACGKSPGDGPHTVMAALAVDDPRVEDGVLYVGATGSTVHLGIKTNIPDWTPEVMTGGGWATVEPLREPVVPATGLEVVQKVRIAVGENTSAGAREAVVKIGGAGIERTLKVIQAAAGRVLDFESPVYAAAAGETVEVAVTANVEYTVTMPAGCPWIENVTISSQELRFSVAENGGTEPRSASIVVAASNVPDLRRTLVVEQQGGGPAINVDGPQEVALAWDETLLELNVTANVAYHVELDYPSLGPEWIWNATTRAITMKKETFVLNHNRAANPRTVTVQLFSKDISPAVKREVKVTQKGYPGVADDVFELWTAVERSVGYAGQDVVVEIRTGRQVEEIVCGTLPDWIEAVGEPVRTGDMLAWTFKVAENLWPSVRNHIMTFSAGDKTLTVRILQDGAPTGYQTVDYNSLSGPVSGGSFGLLCDFDLATSLTGGQNAGWPKEWEFGLRRPDRNEFNQIIYYPIVGTPAYGITDYELLACSHASGTWYTVASGSIPASLYQSEESMWRGHVIAFPTVENARWLTLRVKNSRGGSTFGASELHFAYDYTQKVASAPSIEVLAPLPVTVAASASSASFAVAATTPYSVTFGGAPSWIAHDDSRSAPGTLGFAVQANPGAERSATVTLRSIIPGVNVEKNFTITQAANTNHLSFLSTESGRIEVAESGGGFTVDLSTNLAKDAISIDGLPHWLTVTEKSDIAGGVRFRFSAEVNSGGARPHTITFSGGGLALSLVVNQAASSGLVPTLSLRLPTDGKVSLDAKAGSFAVVLATNMGPADITASTFPEWLAAEPPVHGNGAVTWNFTAKANIGDARKAVLTFMVENRPPVSVEVRQSESALPGRSVSPTEAVWYDHSINARDAYEAIDGNKGSCFTVPAAGIWAYEFRFPFGTDLVAFIYYPQDADIEHGTFKKIGIEAVCHKGGVKIETYVVEIPPSLYATAAGRRAGYLINLPVTAKLVSHLRIMPVEGYQANYSIAEIEFFGPK